MFYCNLGYKCIIYVGFNVHNKKRKKILLKQIIFQLMGGGSLAGGLV